ncbi:MAG: hypothetical protein JSU79_05820 [Dehalococcoidales bacterium]|nr:MAG: hypothetical protein JSU79_05820 [Dehalococcoidales bacterium]
MTREKWGNASPSHQDIHHLFDSFDKTKSGALGRSMGLPLHIGKLIIYTEFPELRILDRYIDKDRVLLMSDGEQVIGLLGETHGSGTKVTVYPSADIQNYG